MDQHYQGAPPPDPMLGQTIGNYLVRQKLGEGGMGSVYMAEHPHIGKKVALKILHAEFASNPDVVARFFNEAKAVNDIGHPNIVDIIDYGVMPTGPSGEGLVYFIMEFLPGVTLSELVRREAPLPPERALAIALQVADALSASHKSNVVHRDLKPDNIILIQRGREKDFVKLLDFGIAKLTGDQPGSRRTRTGLVMGTPAYMSPEQCEGRGNVDHRADIYALGIVLYELLTGRVPFHGEGYGEVLVQHLAQAPARPSTIRPDIPPHVEQVVLKCLEKNTERRFPSMDELGKALMDPVGYVESHGGVANFLTTDIVPSNEPVEQVARSTPSMIASLTPAPGSISVPTPTTLGGTTGQYAAADPASSKKGLFIGLGLLIAAGAVVAAVMLGGGGDDAPRGAGMESASTEVPNQAAAGRPAGDPERANEVAASAGSDAAAAVVAPDAGTPSVVTPSDDEAVAVAEIMVTVESEPSGASVRFAKEVQPRGKTPLTFKVPRSDTQVSIALALPGFVDQTKTVKLSGDVELNVPLKKRPVPTGPRPGGKNPKPGKGRGNCTDADLMDPFATGCK